MGLTRKITSVFTLGLVDFRSAKDRTAAHTKAIRRQSKKQTRLLREQAVRLPAQPPSASPLPPPAPASSVADELGRLAALRDAGVLTDEEFAAQKTRLLG